MNPIKMPKNYTFSFENPKRFTVEQKQRLYKLLTQRLPIVKGETIAFEDAEGKWISMIPLTLPEQIEKFCLRKTKTRGIPLSLAETVHLKNTIYLNIAEGDDGQQTAVYRVIKNHSEHGRVIGEGGFGRVKASDYAIYLDDKNRTVEIREEPFVEKKQRQNHPSENADQFRERITKEYAYAKQNGVKVDKPVFISEDGNPDGPFVAYMHMQRKAGRSLAAALKRKSEEGGISNLPLADRFNLIAQIANEIAKMHQEQRVHHDIKPANIIYNALRKKAEFIDFGSVAIVGEKSFFPFTIRYAGPEINTEEKKGVRKAFDIFSLAPTFAEILSAKASILFKIRDKISSYEEAVKQPYCFSDALPSMEIINKKDEVIDLKETIIEILEAMTHEDAEKRPVAEVIAKQFKELEARASWSATRVEALRSCLEQTKIQLLQSKNHLKKPLSEKNKKQSAIMRQVLDRLNEIIDDQISTLTALALKSFINPVDIDKLHRTIEKMFNDHYQNTESLTDLTPDQRQEISWIICEAGAKVEVMQPILLYFSLNKIGEELQNAINILDEDIRDRNSEQGLSEGVSDMKKTKKALLQDMKNELQGQFSLIHDTLSREKIDLSIYRKHFADISTIFNNKEREEELGINQNHLKKILHGIVRYVSFGLYDLLANRRYNFFTPKSQQTAHRAEDAVRQCLNHQLV